GPPGAALRGRRCFRTRPSAPLRRSSPKAPPLRMGRVPRLKVDSTETRFACSYPAPKLAFGLSRLWNFFACRHFGAGAGSLGCQRFTSRVRFWVNRTLSRHRRMTESDPGCVKTHLVI